MEGGVYWRSVFIGGRRLMEGGVYLIGGGGRLLDGGV